MSAELFAEAYQTAIYKAAGVAFTLSEQPTGTVLFGGRPFAIITAHNPRSERLSDAENQERHEELEREIQKLSLEYTPSTGASPDGTWVEEGFAVFDIALDSALELGRKYGQHAILWGEGERVALAWCEDGRLEWFWPKRKAEKYSRLTPDGRIFWWTDRLWELSKELPVTTVEIGSIPEFEQNCWFSSAQEATCKAVAEHAKRILEADLSYPIILSAEGRLMDGGHRIAKAWLAGLKEIKAVRFTTDPEPDWIEKEVATV